jgi:molybdate transport system regulatory protein
MNRLRGRVVGIESNGHVSLVDVESGGDLFTATVLEAPGGAPYMQVGADVALMFKETEVSLAKNLAGLISLRNRFQATVTMIERGDILSAVQLDYLGQPLASVITTRAVERLQLAPGDAVEALIKANEMMLGMWT